MIIIFIHGLGQSSLSFSLLQSSLASLDPSLQFFSYDLPLHGSAIPSSYNLSLESLTTQLLDLLLLAYPPTETKKLEFLIVGHSLGGAIAVSATPLIQTQVGTVLGIVLLDIVEGTALESLNQIKLTKNLNRPSGFHSFEDAKRWMIESGTCRNRESLERSLGDCLIDRGEEFNFGEKKIAGNKGRGMSAKARLGALLEEGGSGSTEVVEAGEGNYRFIWKVDILKTEEYWSGWFRNLSNSFLSLKIPKLLIVANTDRLDTPLTIAEMSGTIQLAVMKNVGHLLHEDDPEGTAKIIFGFYKRTGVSSEEILRRVRKVGAV